MSSLEVNDRNVLIKSQYAISGKVKGSSGECRLMGGRLRAVTSEIAREDDL